MKGLHLVVVSPVREEANPIAQYLRDAGAQVFEVASFDELDPKGLLPHAVVVLADEVTPTTLCYDLAAYSLRQPTVCAILLTADIRQLPMILAGSDSRIRLVARSAPYWVLKEAIRRQTSRAEV